MDLSYNYKHSTSTSCLNLHVKFKSKCAQLGFLSEYHQHLVSKQRQMRADGREQPCVPLLRISAVIVWRSSPEEGAIDACTLPAQRRAPRGACPRTQPRLTTPQREEERLVPGRRRMGGTFLLMDPWEEEAVPPPSAPGCGRFSWTIAGLSSALRAVDGNNPHLIGDRLKSSGMYINSSSNLLLHSVIKCACKDFCIFCNKTEIPKIKYKND